MSCYLKQRMVGLEQSLNESRVDEEAHRATLDELTSRLREKEAALQSLEGKVRQMEEERLAQTKVFFKNSARFLACRYIGPLVK